MKTLKMMVGMLILVASITMGCNESDDTGNYISYDPSTQPKINAVKLFDGETQIMPYEADTGTIISTEITFFDYDHNIRQVYIDFYHESDNFTTSREMIEINVPPVTMSSFTYLFDDYKYVVSDTKGFWKIIFYCVDADGQESPDFEINFLVK